MGNVGSLINFGRIAAAIDPTPVVAFRSVAGPAAPPASLRRPVDYPVEAFTDAERARLAPHVTNLDRPVFALVNLPETVKGALFARYSRYQGTLRRLFLDEFADSLPEVDRPWDAGEGERAAQLYERIFLGYGDDSVAQLGGLHVACEWVSNVLTKVLQRPRLGGLPRAVDALHRLRRADARRRGYRYYRDPSLGPEYARAMDALFDTYAESLPKVEAWADAQFPPPDGEPSAAHRRAIQAKALDLLRGLLPAASLSHMGIYATGQTYEQLILHLLAHPLPEARAYGRMLLDAVKAVIPSFVARVERPDRGGEWVAYLEERERAAERWVARLGLDRPGGGRRGAAVGAPAARRRRRGRAPRRAAVRGRGRERGGHAHPAERARRRRARARCWPTSSARAPTAATAPAAASRRCATASRSSPTTAPSATSSATACSPSSGSA